MGMNVSYVSNGTEVIQTSNKLPKLIDLTTQMSAISPAILSNKDCCTKANIKHSLRIIDEQQAINRFKWINLPEGLDSRLIERILYYRGQGMFFRFNGKFMFLPYALHPKEGTTGLDVYGRYTATTPLPFNGVGNAKKDKDGKPTPWIQGLSRDVIYDVQIPDDYIDEETGEILVNKILSVQENSCVLIKDYSEQLSQENVARQLISDKIIDLESDMYPLMRTALLAATGINAMKVSNENDYSNVEAAALSVNQAALNGQLWIPVVGSIDFQELTNGQVAKAEEYMLAMQSIDNYRLRQYGLENGGLFLKQGQVLNDEIQLNISNGYLSYKDSLKYRQDRCTIINSIWGLDMWCLPDESILGIDYTGDGMIGADPGDSDNNYNSSMSQQSMDNSNEGEG